MFECKSSAVIFVLGIVCITGAPWPPVTYSDFYDLSIDRELSASIQADSGARRGGIRPKFHQDLSRVVTPRCRCVDVKACPVIMAEIQWRPIDETLQKRLRSLACGFRGSEPQVCCPSESDSYDFDGRMRRTPHDRNSWNDWEVDATEDGYGDNHFGLFHFPAETKPHSGSRSKPARRNKPKPVVWPEDDNQTTTTSSPVTSKTVATTAKPPPRNSSREDRIVNNNRSTLVNPNICGVAINNRIIGGDDAGPGQFPWVARIGYRTPGSSRLLYRCGGAMINKNYVITAAHCVTNLPQTLQLAGIRLGEVEDSRDDTSGCSGTDCAEAPQDFRIGRVIIHPRYDTPRFANDIALVRLSRPANMTGYVSPICLPFGQFRLSEGNNLTGNSVIVAGWGSMTQDTATSSTSLQWARLSVGDIDECRRVYRNRFNISVTSTHMCTRPRANVDACQGDSGGPLVMESPNERYLLTGIVSFGPRRCGTADLPGVYTRVSSFVDWVVSNVSP